MDADVRCFAASLVFTCEVRALRTRQLRARRAMRRCSSLRAGARGVVAPCLARRHGTGGRVQLPFLGL